MSLPVVGDLDELEQVEAGLVAGVASKTAQHGLLPLASRQNQVSTEPGQGHLVADRDVRVINNDGELIATFTIDPTKQYQTKNRPGLNP